MPERSKFPLTRHGQLHKVEITTEEGPLDLYVNYSTFSNGLPGEVFAWVGKHEVPWLDQWCRAISILLQSGHSVTDLVRWFGYTKFQPAGFTNDELKSCHSLCDYVVRWLQLKFPEPKEQS